MQQFSPWIAGFPGLIWSIDIPHSRLKVFNRWSIPGLDVPRLLKDARYRKIAVRREDHALLMEFWDMLTARRPAAVTFRLTNGNGTYILQGWPGENDTLYYGFLKEAFLPAAYSADGRPGTCQMDIGGIGYPVFALDIPTRGLLIINDAARSLFAAASRDPNTLGLADIAPGLFVQKIPIGPVSKDDAALGVDDGDALPHGVEGGAGGGVELHRLPSFLCCRCIRI